MSKLNDLTIPGDASCISAPDATDFRQGTLILKDSQCTKPDSHGYCHCAIRTGGDVLSGVVEVAGPLNVNFTVEVKLEGICRTWIGNEQNYSQIRVPTAVSEHRFLQEVDTVEHCPSPTDAATKTEIQLPFSFVIPRRLISARPVSDLRFLRLHPTVKMGCSFDDYPTKSRYMQPLVFYHLLATIRQKEEGRFPPLPQCEREAIIMPTQAPDPPLYAESYGREYKLQSRVKLRRHLYNRPCGSLELSASEPLSLNLLVAAPRASTTVPIKVSFTPKHSATSDIVPYDWTLVVKSYVRMRVFYSAKCLDREPTLTDVAAKRHIALSTRLTAAEAREYSSLSWRVDRRSPFDAPGDADKKQLPWLAKLQAMVTAPKTLPPSFLSQTAALRYSIVLEVTVANMQMSAAVLELPVQVIRDPRTSYATKTRISMWALSTELRAIEPPRDLDSYPGIERELDEESGDDFDDFHERSEGPPTYRRWI
ncbi:hypothetical protein NA57DRAFT_59407 [Rhizodiscina lignyota]|uniref:Arrestin-like N-terminal domain-containing protein n=1 Tax=Rhizodiscina lignyota TaxID=1504668 RepID=A0A9P4I9K5_9PEZI|nr:hypothetical protein NA57DRAFT_59407 [Rhizodiscina lignyota]